MNSPQASVLYALLCVVLPTLWGITMVWTLKRVEGLLHRRRKAQGKTPPAPVRSPEYHI